MWEVALQQHGEYVAGRLGQVVLFGGRGPWNDESLYDGTKMLGESIDGVDKARPWAQFSLLVGESIMPPSAYALFVKQTLIRKQKGLSALAIVIVESDIRSTIQQQLTVAYDKAGIEHQYFGDYYNACYWLNQQGFELELDSLKQHIDTWKFVPKAAKAIQHYG